jgi:hypothetical protein
MGGDSVGFRPKMLCSPIGREREFTYCYGKSHFFVFVWLTPLRTGVACDREYLKLRFTLEPLHRGVK